MIKFISSLVLALMLSGGHTDHPKVGAVNCPVKEERGTDIKDKLYVSVEFSIKLEDFKNHQFLVSVFTSAVAAWADVIPMRTTFYFEGMLPVPGMPPISPFSPQDRAYVIEIGFADLQSKPYEYDKNIIGIWEPHFRRILFDLDFFQKNPLELYSVALHELGHAFGLPHIVNRFEPGYTGYLVLAEGDARDLVMYPFAFKDKPQDKLSDVEIEFARHQILYIFSQGVLSRQSECQLAVDHSQ